MAKRSWSARRMCSGYMHSRSSSVKLCELESTKDAPDGLSQAGMWVVKSQNVQGYETAMERRGVKGVSEFQTTQKRKARIATRGRHHWQTGTGLASDVNFRDCLDWHSVGRPLFHPPSMFRLFPFSCPIAFFPLTQPHYADLQRN